MPYLSATFSAAALFDWPSFFRPGLLWWGIPTTVLVTYVAWYIDGVFGKKALKDYGDLQFVSRFSRLPKFADRTFTLLVLTVVACCFVVAAAGPYEQVAPIKVPAGSMRLVFVQDTSRSTAAEDARESMPLFGGPDCSTIKGPCGNRVQVGITVLLTQIMPALEGNALGLVSFATGSAVYSYLNYEFAPLHAILKDYNWMKVGSGHGYASNITEGLKAAEKVFDRDGPRKQGVEDVIILAADGGFSGGDSELDAEARKLRHAGFRLIILGLGSALPSPIPVYDADGALKGQFLSEGVKRDDAFLSRLAQKAGGQYIALTPGQPLNIYWPSTLAGDRIQFQSRNLYAYPIALSMILLVVLWLRMPALHFSERLGEAVRRRNLGQQHRKTENSDVDRA